MSASALLFRPRPKEQEGLMGYLLRLVDENYLTGIGELLRLTLSSPDRGYVRYAVTQALDFSAPQLERLASQLGLSVEMLQCLNDPLGIARGLEHPTDAQSFLYGVLRRDVHRVWCPECLQEDEFLRKAWDWILTTRCPHHHCLLVERCAKCDGLVRWRTATLAACGCGFELKKASAPKVDRDMLAMSVLITGIAQEQVDAAPDFVCVAEDLRVFVDRHRGPSSSWGSWGAYDRKQLQRECGQLGVEPLLGLPHQNLKRLFARRQRIGKEVGMAMALRMAGIQLEGQHHRALADACNIAKLLPWISGTRLLK